MNVGRASDVAGIIGITGSGGSVSGGGTGHPRGFSRSRVGRGGRDIEEEPVGLSQVRSVRGRTPLPLLACLGKVFETVPTPFSGSKKVKRLGPGDSSRAFTSRWSLQEASRFAVAGSISNISNNRKRLFRAFHAFQSIPFQSIPFQSIPSIHPSIHLSVPPFVRPSVCLLHQSPWVLAGPFQG